MDAGMGAGVDVAEGFGWESTTDLALLWATIASTELSLHSERLLCAAS